MTPQQMQQMTANQFITNNARRIYGQLTGNAAQKFGGPENIPADVMDKIKHTAQGQAQNMWAQQMARRTAQQQQQQQMIINQQQQQQQAAMQGMNGMMGQQGM